MFLLIKKSSWDCKIEQSPIQPLPISQPETTMTPPPISPPAIIFDISTIFQFDAAFLEGVNTSLLLNTITRGLPDFKSNVIFTIELFMFYFVVGIRDQNVFLSQVSEYICVYDCVPRFLSRRRLQELSNSTLEVKEVVPSNSVITLNRNLTFPDASISLLSQEIRVSVTYSSPTRNTSLLLQNIVDEMQQEFNDFNASSLIVVQDPTIISQPLIPTAPPSHPPSKPVNEELGWILSIVLQVLGLFAIFVSYLREFGVRKAVKQLHIAKRTQSAPILKQSRSSKRKRKKETKQITVTRPKSMPTVSQLEKMKHRQRDKK